MLIPCSTNLDCMSVWFTKILISFRHGWCWKFIRIWSIILLDLELSASFVAHLEIMLSLLRQLSISCWFIISVARWNETTFVFSFIIQLITTELEIWFVSSNFIENLLLFFLSQLCCYCFLLRISWCFEMSLSCGLRNVRITWGEVGFS